MIAVHHIVLNQRVGAPAVDGQGSEAAIDVEAAAMGDWAIFALE